MRCLEWPEWHTQSQVWLLFAFHVQGVYCDPRSQPVVGVTSGGGGVSDSYSGGGGGGGSYSGGVGGDGREGVGVRVGGVEFAERMRAQLADRTVRYHTSTTYATSTTIPVPVRCDHGSMARLYTVAWRMIECGMNALVYVCACARARVCV